MSVPAEADTLNGPLDLIRGHNSETAGQWVCNAYPQVGESVHTWVSGRRREPAPGPTQPQDAEANEQRAARRARTQARRYAIANKCNKLTTLTQAEEYRTEDPLEMKARMDRFCRVVFAYTGHPVPMLWVVERGEKGTKRLHIHVAHRVYLPKSVLRKAWSYGFVEARRIEVRGGLREQCRVAASYLSKYLSKESERGGFGRHRYEVTQGFQPELVRRSTQSLYASVEAAREVMGGGELVTVAASEDWEDWRGPPVRVATWGA